VTVTPADRVQAALTWLIHAREHRCDTFTAIDTAISELEHITPEDHDG
jgi:ribosome-associated translation inhibitor RaiA